MRKSLLASVFMVLFASSLAYAENYSGTYTLTNGGVTLTLSLRQNAPGKVTGTLTSSNGMAYQVEGTVRNDGVVGTCKSSVGGVYFTAQLKVNNLVFILVDPDANGQPNYSTAKQLVLARQGGAAPSAPSPQLLPPGDAVAAPGKSMLTANALADLSKKFKGNLQRESPDDVLVKGNPPLTYGSVANFVQVVSEIFNIEFTEAEFEITRQEMMAYYKSREGQRKAFVATCGAGWLKALHEGTPQQRETSRQELHTLLAQVFEQGAQEGSPWETAMNDAIQRRSKAVQTASAKPPEFARKDGFDNTLSEADLCASLEMLYFMWVASGRAPQLVTAQAATQVRMLIAQNFPQYAPNLQYFFANAQKVYAQLRAAWGQANNAQRLQMARQFSADLDALGLTVPAARGDNVIHAQGAWSDVNGKTHSAWAADMVQGLAGSSYKSAW